MVKREQSSSPAPSEYGSPPSPSSSVDVKATKKRAQKQTPSPSKKAKSTPTKSPKSKPDGVITNEIKAAMVAGAFDLAYKQLPFDQYAAESGIAASRLKDQFKPNRSNLRSKLVESVSGSAH